MFVIMCKIKSHTHAGEPDDEMRLESKHPVYAAKNLRAALSWMRTEPEVILNHLNNIIAEEEWELGKCKKFSATLWNKSHTRERIYFLEEVRK